MDKIEYRVVIKFFAKESLTPNEIHAKFIKVCRSTLFLEIPVPIPIKTGLRAEELYHTVSTLSIVSNVL
jgi:hypothetical protein